MKLKSEDWKAVGIESLETSAMESVKEHSNLLILAGPGAGKTELLAQKACYLLQTGNCIYPKRILAISFKRDAATNLKDRVRKRCEEESFRFDSLTFDAFAKSILDRFRNSLPLALKPSRNYEIGLTMGEIGSLLESLEFHNRPENQPLLNILRSHGWTKTNLISNFDKMFLTSFQLNDPNRNHEYILNWAADNLWTLLLRGVNGKSKLSFQMVSRLAQLIVNTNPLIKKSIQTTYSHVFLDEFQDTTSIQYEFLKNCFLGSSSRLTSVGDGKQRIMLWAGAQEDVFERYLQDFNAQRKRLVMNYRCAPRLVELQTIVARFLDAAEVGQTPHHEEGGIIRRIDFRDNDQEASELAIKVQKMINEENILPEQICFLLKQRIPENSLALIQKIQERGIKARVEDTFQELLKEEFVQLLISFISYIFDLNTQSRDEVLKILINENQLISEVRRVEGRIRDLKRNWINEQDNLSTSINCVTDFIDDIVNFVGMPRILSLVPHYNTEIVSSIKINFINKFYEILNRNNNLCNSVDEFIGKGVVKCMSIHKSKGLEFEVVILIGLEDRMYWNFAAHTREEINTFFVAISRPINQLYITFCNRRDNQLQSRNSIAPLYGFLDSGRVTHVNRTGN